MAGEAAAAARITLPEFEQYLAKAADFLRGSYDPDRYYSAVREYGHDYMNYIRDNYGDLDTYESNRPD